MSENQGTARYRLLRRLAAGGMGEIHLAAQVGPAGYERVVALKRMLPTMLDGEGLNLFLDEARLMTQLSHRNICQIVELGQDAQGYFVALEFITGASVVSVLEKLNAQGERLDPHYAVDIAAQVAEALAYVYSARGRDGQPLHIIHRDVSPHNVLLSTAGDVKLIDFGVAKSKQQRHATQSGLVKGKFGYLSPEQSRGEELDGRSDLFALGIVLYEMVTGTNPFEKPDLVAMMKAIQSDEVAPLGTRDPRWLPLDPVMAKLLAKRPEDRYPDANVAAEALLDLRSALPRPPQRLGAFIGERFGAEIESLQRVISDSEIPAAPHQAAPGAGLPPIKESLAPPVPPSPSVPPAGAGFDKTARSSFPPGVLPPVKAAPPAANSARPEVPDLPPGAIKKSPVPWLVAGVLGLAVVAGLLRRTSPPPVEDLQPAVTPPLPKVVAPPPEPVASAAASAALAPTPTPAAPPIAAPPVAAPLVEKPPPARAVVSPMAPVVAKAARRAEERAAPVALGVLVVSGTEKELRAPSGHLDLADPSGHFQLGLDYTIGHGGVKAVLTTTPWALVSINGPIRGNTKAKPVELPVLGEAPVRLELEHPGLDTARMVMSFRPHSR